jgi:hypothetical protein
MSQHDHRFGCGCDCGCDRRDFLAAISASLGGLIFTPWASGSDRSHLPPAGKQNASILGVRVGPVDAPAESYTAAVRESAERWGGSLDLDDRPVADADQADSLARRIQASRPDGLVLIVLDKDHLPLADVVLSAAEKLRAPMVPVMLLLADPEIPVEPYRREGLVTLGAQAEPSEIEFGVRMINTGKLLRQCTVLGFDNREPSEATVPFFGVKLRMIPFERYAQQFAEVSIDDAARQRIAQFTGGASERLGITDEALQNAARAHLALEKIMAEERADGLTMNCLRRGWLKPCMSFATFNGQLIPAACEMDVPALCTMLVGRLLVGRPGFMHNMAIETERNHYYASHCTCPTKLYGPDGPELPHLLRRFAHTNEGSCAIQVFWNEGDPATLVRVYPGGPARMDVYAARVFASHPMPPVGGCTTNVEVELLDREDAMMAVGHHNVLFCGDFARQFRLFAQLYRIQLLATGYEGPWPL